MDDTKILTIEQLQRILESMEALSLRIYRKEECLEWIHSILIRFKYRALNRKHRGIVRRYIRKMTGYSSSQLDTLISRYRLGVPLRKAYTRHSFQVKYTRKDVLLLADTDSAHNHLSGEAMQSILRREFELFTVSAYETLSQISVAHIYNLRKSFTYKQATTRYEKTKPVRNDIGIRKKPFPNGCPGFLRVDTVHQGDCEGEKGVYHINTVDEVTQWEIVGCVESIEWKSMRTLLASLLEQYPFEIRGFHADNGSEYINKQVAQMLTKLLIELTKSRARRSNDNALVESKNGSVIRKHMGYIHIPRENAPRVHAFYSEYFNPYLNFHRPSGFATKITDAKGKVRKHYDEYTTPYEKLKSLPNAAVYLKPGLTFAALDRIAYAQSDTTAAQEMNKAKKALFKNFIYPFNR
jgi:transposase InsO family protein